MAMKRSLLLLLLISVSLLAAQLVCEDDARVLAEKSLRVSAPEYRIRSHEELVTDSRPLAYIYHLEPMGYVALSAHQQLPVLISYSFESDFHSMRETSIMEDLIVADLSARLRYGSRSAENQEAWIRALNPGFAYNIQGEYLLQSAWSQNYPWNMMVPMDPVSNVRSVAGCPAIAMGQILNYLQTTNNTRLDDGDDYYHSFSGRNYMIDDDHADLGFPDFSRLNGYLSEIDAAFARDIPLSDSLAAALVFASGTALKQVYSSQVSGTMGVNQAFTAYQRFGFDEAVLLEADAGNLYARINQNLANGYLVHLAVVTPSWDAGHNVVIDGYDSDNELHHLNFGWGGSYNAWYSLPQGIPYGLTVVEGAIVDIYPKTAAICIPESIDIQAGQTSSVEIMNLTDAPLELIQIRFPQGLSTDDFSFSPQLPVSIEDYGILSFSISHIGRTGEAISGDLRLVFDQNWCLLPFSFTPAVSILDSSPELPKYRLRVGPNPFRQTCHFELEPMPKSPSRLHIYNLKGQKVYESTLGSWDGRDQAGRICPSGIYLYRVESLEYSGSGKILKL
jgi:hypothetical protein